MGGRIAALVMAGLLALYLAFVAQYAVRLILDPHPIATIMGVALLVLPLIGAYALVAELVFAVRAQRLARRLEAAGQLPEDHLPTLPSGRPDPAAADAEFLQFKAAVEAEPTSWQAWFRLGLAYDASGDRKRARWATREAIRLERASQG